MQNLWRIVHIFQTIFLSCAFDKQMSVSCQFVRCKVLLVTSLTHVSSVVESIRLLPFTFFVISHDKGVMGLTFPVSTIQTHSVQKRRT